MWVDKKLYWSWVEDRQKNKDGGYDTPMPPPPTVKKIDYVTINKGAQLLVQGKGFSGTGEGKLAIGVWDDDKYTPLYRDQLEWHLVEYCFDDTPEEYRPVFGRLVKRPA